MIIALGSDTAYVSDFNRNLIEQYVKTQYRLRVQNTGICTPSTSGFFTVLSPYKIVQRSHILNSITHFSYYLQQYYSLCLSASFSRPYVIQGATLSLLVNFFIARHINIRILILIYLQLGHDNKRLQAVYFQKYPSVCIKNIKFQISLDLSTAARR